MRNDIVLFIILLSPTHSEIKYASLVASKYFTDNVIVVVQLDHSYVTQHFTLFCNTIEHIVDC